LQVRILEVYNKLFYRGFTSGGDCLILLCDVAVGKKNVLEKTDYNAASLPKVKKF